MDQATPPRDSQSTYQPYVEQQATDALASQTRSLLQMPLLSQNMVAPFCWLVLGWRDFRTAPFCGLYFGLCFFLMGHLLWWVFSDAPEYVLALSAGFLLTAPFLCVGIYYVSRQLEKGLRPLWSEAVFAWTTPLAGMLLFCGLLLLLELLWARASLVVFAVAYEGALPGAHSVGDIFSKTNMPFLLAYVGVGAVFAAIIFSISVVALPLMLDRQCDAITAALVSARAVLQNMPAMMLWALLIAALSLLALLPWFAGLIVIMPIIGHASWHAYRAMTGKPQEEAATPAA